MKKLILTAAICLGTIMASGQGLNDGYFGLFTDVHNPEIDCNTGLRDDMMVQRCLTKDFISDDPNDSTRGADLTTYTYIKPVNTSGLYGNVARGVAAQRLRRNGSSAKSSSTRSVGTNNYNTSDAHIQWARNRQAQIQAAREEAAYKRRMEEMQKKIADDNRAAAVTAQTNAALQGQTDARIQRDRWHATEGAAKAQQRARQAVVVQGPQFDKMKPQSTGSQQASRLRGANKPRRFMAPQNTNARNTSRKPMPAVQRNHTLSPQQRQELRQAILNRREQQRQKRLAIAESQKSGSKKSPAAYYDDKGRLVIDEHAYSSLGKNNVNNRGSKPVPYPKPTTPQSPGARYTGDGRLVLDSHAHSSLGQDWRSGDLEPLPAPPSAATRIRRKMTQEEYHNLVVIEMIDQRPLTPSEKEYYDNLSL